MSENGTGRFTPELEEMVWGVGHRCSGCGHEFAEGEIRYEGYAAGGKPYIACVKCKVNLSELARWYEYRERPFKVPPDDSKLWRYMDFAKYVSLLSTRAIFFARTDTFDDAFEGAQGLLSNQGAWDNYYRDFFRNALRSPLPDGDARVCPDEKVESEAERLLAQMKQAGETRRYFTYANCWHENEHESEAMWRLYSSYLENALAVRTTTSRLRAAIGNAGAVEIGRIKYIDFRKEYAGINSSFWRKRMSFQHEREVRALHIDFERKPGILMPCDLSVLVDAVFVSPKAPAWLAPLINDVNGKYGLSIDVTSSELGDKAFW
ncbi:hypothetical protein [Frateuria sp. Soil773]|uniref:hypothetical protein n=1 Tax=Frateuria sp. Soil773 TaxID=1736407 RepID=UPI000ACA3556|nr:hypothetical protein [Frateuria sp. Soil773]